MLPPPPPPPPPATVTSTATKLRNTVGNIVTNCQDTVATIFNKSRDTAENITTKNRETVANIVADDQDMGAKTVAESQDDTVVVARSSGGGVFVSTESQDAVANITTNTHSTVANVVTQTRNNVANFVAESPDTIANNVTKSQDTVVVAGDSGGGVTIFTLRHAEDYNAASDTAPLDTRWQSAGRWMAPSKRPVLCLAHVRVAFPARLPFRQEGGGIDEAEKETAVREVADFIATGDTGGTVTLWEFLAGDDGVAASGGGGVAPSEGSDVAASEGGGIAPSGHSGVAPSEGGGVARSGDGDVAPSLGEDLPQATKVWEGFVHRGPSGRRRGGVHTGGEAAKGAPRLPSLVPVLEYRAHQVILRTAHIETEP